jgi:hypothetical protein
MASSWIKYDPFLLRMGWRWGARVVVIGAVTAKPAGAIIVGRFVVGFRIIFCGAGSGRSGACGSGLRG